MKDPKFGKNAIQSFIEFDIPEGLVRFGEEDKKLFIEINESKTYLTNSNGDIIATIAESTSGEGVTIEGVNLNSNKLSLLTGGISLTPTVTEFTTIVTLSATEIVGTSAGDIGHVDGAILVAALSSGYALEFVSALLIYDYATAAYTGGADDTVIQIGDVGSQNTVSGAITGANLLTAAGDKVLRLGAIATEVIPLVGGALSIAGTAITQPGTAAGVLRVHITYRVHTTGL